MLVSGATATVKRYPLVGELIVPAAGNDPDELRLIPGRWAMDNGAYIEFNPALFMRMLQRFHGRKGCRFVSCPDVVGDAKTTLDLWPFWSKVIRGVGFVPALVAQDGMLASEIPWKEIGALFIGGLTEWKLGPQARELAAYAKARGLWVHVGRVNSGSRIFHIQEMGADSFDGTGYSMMPDTNIPKGLRWVDEAVSRPQGLPL